MERITAETIAAEPITALRGAEDLTDLTAIERELAAMWRSASTDQPGIAVARACRTNLVVLANDDAPAFLDGVMVRHPARLIVVTADKARGDVIDAPPIRAHVDALCHRRPGEGKGQGLVCSERVIVLVREGEEERVPSLVRGLAVGGLPAVLMLVSVDGSALERTRASRLLQTADRVLIDSTGAEASVWTHLAVAHPRLFDLAWLRLAEYRRVIASAIERSPLGKRIHRLESVDIAHAGRPTWALLLAGWLSYRLHWSRPRRAERSQALAADTGTSGGSANSLEVYELKAGGRRVRLRFGPAPEGESLVVLFRNREDELRVALDATGSQATIARGAGHHTLARSGRAMNARLRRPARVEMSPLTPADLVVQGLDHAGLCNRDAPPVLARAQAFAALH